MLLSRLNHYLQKKLSWYVQSIKQYITGQKLYNTDLKNIVIICETITVTIY